MAQDTDIFQKLNQIEDQLRRTEILIRTNNLLLSRFIVELTKTRKDLGLPKLTSAFSFTILEEDYKKLVEEFGKNEVDKAFYKLDRLLLMNKQNCPNNIAKYIRKKLIKRVKNNEEYGHD